MANLKVNLTDSVVPPKTEVKAELAKEPEKEAPKKKEVFKHRVPANWVITAEKDGISAVCSVSGESFKGSTAEFNKRMRG